MTENEITLNDIWIEYHQDKSVLIINFRKDTDMSRAKKEIIANQVMRDLLSKQIRLIQRTNYTQDEIIENLIKILTGEFKND